LDINLQTNHPPHRGEPETMQKRFTEKHSRFVHEADDSGWHRGHHAVVRPPIVAWLSGVRWRGQRPDFVHR
jgi:hypothetical protein